MSTAGAGPRAPLVRVHMVEAPHGGVIIGILGLDNERHGGGTLRLTPAALAALPGELVDAIARFRQQVA
ncbi:MAG: hypothetical protein IPJ78_13450 [Gemmatimonadetes bacterium]|nr:hypothetical protein [Gemmatimonadota bacterium]